MDFITAEDAHPLCTAAFSTLRILGELLSHTHEGLSGVASTSAEHVAVDAAYTLLSRLWESHAGVLLADAGIEQALFWIVDRGARAPTLGASSGGLQTHSMVRASARQIVAIAATSAKREMAAVLERLFHVVAEQWQRIGDLQILTAFVDGVAMCLLRTESVNDTMGASNRDRLKIPQTAAPMYAVLVRVQMQLEAIVGATWERSALPDADAAKLLGISAAVLEMHQLYSAGADNSAKADSASLTVPSPLFQSLGVCLSRAAAIIMARIREPRDDTLHDGVLKYLATLCTFLRGIQPAPSQAVFSRLLALVLVLHRHCGEFAPSHSAGTSPNDLLISLISMASHRQKQMILSTLLEEVLQASLSALDQRPEQVSAVLTALELLVGRSKMAAVILPKFDQLVLVIVQLILNLPKRSVEWAQTSAASLRLLSVLMCRPQTFKIAPHQITMCLHAIDPTLQAQLLVLVESSRRSSNLIAGLAHTAQAVRASTVVITAVQRLMDAIIRHHASSLHHVIAPFNDNLITMVKIAAIVSDVKHLDDAARVDCGRQVARLLTGLAAPVHRKTISRYVGPIIAEYLALVPTHAIDTNVRHQLLPGINALIGLCGQHDLKHLMAVLPASGKALLRNLWNDYDQHHKYTGKA